MTKKTLGIVFGGVSGEHEVSKITAISVIKNINFSKFEVKAIYINESGQWQTKEKTIKNNSEEILENVDTLIESLTEEPNLFELKKQVDVIFPLIHGTNGEDGTIQGLFEILSIPYVGCGVVGSAMGMDKAVMKDMFKAVGIPQGEYKVFNRKKILENQEETIKESKELGYPIFVKPANAGSSLGVSKVENDEDLKLALQHALRYDNKVVVEEMIVGRELEIGILGFNEIQFSEIGEVETTNYFYDYEAKYQNENATKIQIPAKAPKTVREEMIRIGKQVCEVLNCYGLSRIDFFWNEESNKFYVNEINTIPGFTPYSMYPSLFAEVGIGYSELIEKLVESAFEAYEQKVFAKIITK